MVNETKNVGNRNIAHRISTPKDIEELKEQLGSLSALENSSRFMITTNAQPEKKGFFAKVKTFLMGSKS